MKEFLISSPARIHLGFLELNPKADRVFGSIGLAISKYKTKLKVRSSKEFNISSFSKDYSKKAYEILGKLTKHYNFSPCQINIIESIPSHCGLGSGTQLSLLIGKALLQISKKKINIKKLALILNRGNRSGIGIGCFEKGGFIIDAGKQKQKSIPPIIFNQKWPMEWKLLLIFDNKTSGIYGEQETQEFNKILNVDKNISLYNYKAVITKVIPSLFEKDFENFCLGIQEIQENTAKVFSKAQGGKYISKKIGKIFNHLEKKGIYGYGQSSWGPTGFIICKNLSYQEDILSEIKRFMRKFMIKDIKIEKIEARNSGFFITQSKVNE